MEFFKKEYPDTADVAVDVTYVSFGDRLRAIRKEKGMSQDEFAKLLGTSKQVLSRYEIGQRIPKITQVQEYAKRLNVSADYLMGDSAEEAAFNSLCPKDHPPFYKIFLDVMEQMGLDIARYFSHKQGEQSIEGQLASAYQYAEEHSYTIHP